MKKSVLFLLKLYRFIVSPFFRLVLGIECRFHPSCSTYASCCFERFPFQTALWYTVKRLLRCHPFSQGGVDWPPSPFKE